MPQDNDNSVVIALFVWIGCTAALIISGQNAISEKGNTAENIRGGYIMFMTGLSMLGALFAVPAVPFLISYCCEITEEGARDCLPKISSSWTNTKKGISSCLDSAKEGAIGCLASSSAQISNGWTNIKEGTHDRWVSTKEKAKGCLTSLSSNVSNCWTNTRKKISSIGAGSSQSIDVEAQETSAPLLSIQLSLKEESDKVDSSCTEVPSSSLDSPPDYCQLFDSNVMHAQSSL